MSEKSEKVGKQADKQCANTDWRTPPAVLSAVRDYLGGKIFLDPATTEDNPTGAEIFFTEKENGLSRDWDSKGVFVNPPYGKQLQFWIRKITIEANKRRFPILVLLPPRRWSTVYMHETFFDSNIRDLLIFKKRLAFLDKNGNPVKNNTMGSMLWGLNTVSGCFGVCFNKFGTVFSLKKYRKE